MLILPVAIIKLLEPFETLFDYRTWKKAQLLLVGAILATATWPSRAPAWATSFTRTGAASSTCGGFCRSRGRAVEPAAGLSSCGARAYQNGECRGRFEELVSELGSGATRCAPLP